MRKIGIVGSRRRDLLKDYNLIRDKFFEIYKEGDLIISGGCPKGGDRFAESIAKEYGIPILIFYPNWAKHGNVAGFIRNSHIAETSDFLIACAASDRTGGTEDTIKKFLKHKSEGDLYLV
jgi:hypothetical protein